MKTWVLVGVAAAVLGVGNGLVAHKESILRNGETMLLRLAPRDPRSLIQGDYMVLAYAIERIAPPEGSGTGGRVVVAPDDDGVARYVRFHAGQALGEGERLLRYRRRQGGLRLGAESFFFQDGHAEHYQRARYGEVKVSRSGECVLVGLRGEAFERLGPPE